MRQEMMILQLKLSAAEDELARRKAATEIIAKQIKLEASASQTLASQNCVLRNRVSMLQEKLQNSSKQAKETRTQLVAAVAERDAQLQQLEERMRADSNQALSELETAQALVSRLRNELVLAERTAAAAQERANLAEQTLQQREALATERAQMQADMQHYSQDLAKMALETGTAANAKVLAETQALLGEERSARAAAETRAAASEARAAQLEKQLAQLEGQLERKGQRVARLEEALQQRETATPAGHRAVHAALHAVDALVSQLDNSPESEMPQRRAPAISLLGKIVKEKKGAGGGRNGKADVPAQKAKRAQKASKELSPVHEASEQEDMDLDMEYGEKASPEEKKKERKSRVQKASKALPAILSSGDSDEENTEQDCNGPIFGIAEVPKDKKEKKEAKKKVQKPAAVVQKVESDDDDEAEEESPKKKGGRKAAPARKPRNKAAAKEEAPDPIEGNEEEEMGETVAAKKVQRPGGAETKRKRTLLGGVKTSNAAAVDAFGETKAEDASEELPKAKKNRNARSTAPKLDLQKVWGDHDDMAMDDAGALPAEHAEAPSVDEAAEKKSRKSKKDKASVPALEEASKENLAGMTSKQPPAASGETTKLEQRPLEALNPASVAAAANQIRAVPPPLKPVAARPLLGVSGAGGPAGGKRRLLGVSSGLGAGGGMMTTKLLGSNFTVPKLQGK